MMYNFFVSGTHRNEQNETCASNMENSSRQQGTDEKEQKKEK